MLSREQLLVEMEEIIRTMPPRATIRHETEENVAWFGRASTAIEKWNPPKAPLELLPLVIYALGAHC